MAKNLKWELYEWAADTHHRLYIPEVELSVMTNEILKQSKELIIALILWPFLEIPEE